MGIHVWSIIALIFIISTKAEFYTDVSQSVYERSSLQSSSPAPAQSQSSSLKSTEKKEVVLFLTPDQVKTLKSAGAIVKPYPEYVTEFTEFQQTDKSQNEQQLSTPKEEQLQVNNLENYYKFLNIQNINRDLALQPETEEVTSEKNPQYKYTKSTKQHKEKQYLAPYSSKKVSLPKISNQDTNTEYYVRYLPNYESENLKMAPYQAVPLSPYRLEKPQLNENTQINEAQGYGNANTQSNADVRENFESQTSNKYRLNSQDQSNAQPQSVNEDTDRPLKSKPAADQTNQSPDPEFFLELLRSIGGLPLLEKLQEQLESSTPTPVARPPTTVDKNEMSQRLVQLSQQGILSKSIADKKKELLNDELTIKTKLQEIKNAPYHDDQEYASELERLTKNWRQQNVLAQIEAFSKSSVFVNQDDTENRSVRILKYLEDPVPAKASVRDQSPAIRDDQVTTPYPIQPIPVPVLQKEKGEKAQPTRVQVTKNVYEYLRRQSLARKVAPLPAEYRIPVRVSTQGQEQLRIPRPVWEH